ncbi:hypothetical protein H7X87_04140 [Acetobacteraceae bacterium]|nr:hypothetical protein [Candidatus Parcubacteria bacterium]
MARHKDISIVMIVAVAGVLAYAVFGVFILNREAQGALFSETPQMLTTNL